MSTEGTRFSISMEVRPEDIDLIGHVNNTVYLRWVQDAAVAHWHILAPAEERETILWVVRRHEIDYKRPAFSGDTLKVETWIGKATRFAFDRHTTIINVSSGRILALARTVWCPIDRKTGKPADVSPAVRDLFSIPA
ncbi:MAG: acyl-CoA thioesterase [Chlorobium limicola]|uniref:acyl-CoA thioesterase n=1 Tax=Chlorobium limicola TaxID=1092 RepID=UPI0023F49DDA|nr:thioesterase family protein [Chlorobium limicola]NTV20781.1 acyl-CoA thioesterase [Chlorobium limicola]